MKKHSGYIMLEVIISIMIILTVVTAAVKAYVSTVKTWRRAFITENVKMAVYNISNEIKYNMTYEELQLLFKGKDKISLEYSININKSIMEKNISDLNKGDDITIIKQDDKFEKFLIKCSIPYEENKIIFEYETKKSWWMNEI